MGVTTGSLIEVVRVAPMGDPIDIKIRGYHLSLRKECWRQSESVPLRQPESVPPDTGLNVLQLRMGGKSSLL